MLKIVTEERFCDKGTDIFVKTTVYLPCVLKTAFVK